MDKETYKILKRAHRNIINYHELKKIKLNTPIMKNRVKLMLGEMDANISSLGTKFLKIEKSLFYKDELVITYLLFLAKFLNNTYLVHVFYAPQSNSIFNWILLYKKIVYSIVTLLYNKKFTDDDWFNLDYMIYSLNEGHSDSVRNFLKQMKILTISDEHKIDFETKYDEYYVLTINEFGPLYWRIIHFMAEAINLRKNVDTAKNMWKDFTVHAFYRTLLCSICITHYKTVVEKYKTEMESSSDYATLWFDIHNHINKSINKLEYTKSEFQKDQLIMRDLLSPKKAL